MSKGKIHTAHGEELVEAGDEDGVEDTKDPHPEGVDRHVRVVDVGDGSPNFRVGRLTASSSIKEHREAMKETTHSLYSSRRAALESARVVVPS
jgi:hypothetical protein